MLFHKVGGHLIQLHHRVFRTLHHLAHIAAHLALALGGHHGTGSPEGCTGGTLDVFATPALVALAEKTCWQSVAPALEAGSGTVGTKLELEHTAPTPVGMTVTCHSELVAVEGRKLTFKVTLADEKGPVGGGTHERFIIFEEKFAAKAEAKKG